MLGRWRGRGGSSRSVMLQWSALTPGGFSPPKQHSGTGPVSLSPAPWSCGEGNGSSRTVRSKMASRNKITWHPQFLSARRSAERYRGCLGWTPSPRNIREGPSRVTRRDAIATSTSDGAVAGSNHRGRHRRADIGGGPWAIAGRRESIGEQPPRVAASTSEGGHRGHYPGATLSPRKHR